MVEIKMKKEQLGGGRFVYCSDTHRFGTDAVVLEYFALQNKTPTRVCDLGCGCGIIPMLLVRDGVESITGVDIQDECITLLKSAVDSQGLCDKITPMLADLCHLPVAMNGTFDLVTMNPPYKRSGAGLMSENEGLNIARFEIKCDFSGIAKAAAKLLVPGGRFCVCNRPDRTADMIINMRENSLEPKRMVTVSARRDTAPMLVLIEAVKGGKPDMIIDTPIFIEDEDGRLSKTGEKIYSGWEYERKNRRTKE